MKAYTKILFALLFISTLYSFNASIVPDSKVGYIDTSMVRELPKYKAVYEKLEELKEIEQSNYRQKSEEWERLRSQLEKTQGEFSAEEWKTKIDELTVMQSELIAMEEKSIKFLTNQEGILLQPVLEEINKKIEAIAIEKGYTLLLDENGTVLHVDKNHNLTDTFKSRL